ncbi:MAG: AarF/ABC1/UbiB kinase family protein [Oligoflexia bacterium]|nr:AarF/ABC1/UbiB kinase family protein [Oligoflexia bacterium]
MSNLLTSANRLKQIVSVFGKHGFHNVLERARLDQFILKKITKREEEIEKLSAAERARLAFEELGPTFVKLGQLLSTRPNLIPADFVAEFKKFHDQVAPVSFEEIKLTIEQEFNKPITEIYESFEKEPLAAASIAQVHQAKLKTGEVVVVKVQRPGIVSLIKNDLNVLYTIANLVEKYVPESRVYSPKTIVDEFFKTLELETNFLIEANNMKRISNNFSGEDFIVIPKVYDNYCSQKVLTMQKLEGLPLSQIHYSNEAGNIDREQVVKNGLKAFFEMVFTHGLFHGDLHAGNLFVMSENRIGLVDFGVVGRLSPKTKDSVANMLLAIGTEDYEALTYEYVELAPYNGNINIDQFSKEIRDLFGPYYGMTFKNVNLGKLLMESTSIAAKHQIIMPSELMLFFKAVVTVEGMGRLVLKDFDILSHMLEFSQAIVISKLDPTRVMKDLTQFGRDTSSFLAVLPRQLKQLMRKLNSRDFAFDIHVAEILDLKNSVENSGKNISRALVILALVVVGTLVFITPKGPEIYGIPVLSLVSYFISFILFFRIR